MTPERWQQIEQLFHAALARDLINRDRFLASACGGDEELRREVESLIYFHNDTANFIEKPAGDVAAAILDSDEFRFKPGHEIDNYRIIRRLGSGGMGEVYLADDTKLHRKVALKLLPPQFTVDIDRVRRFEQESRAASALNHPNIVTIYEIGDSGTTRFIATEFIDGVTLRERLTAGDMTLHELLDVAAQVAAALAAAHEAGIVHRDIKPDNIMLRHDGFVKVLDFGLAKLTTSSSEIANAPFNTTPGILIGTAQYMSPEQARGEDMDYRTDIWSLGVVLYEMLTNRLPFEGETRSHSIVAIIEHDPPPLSRYVEVPAELELIVTKTLSKRRDDRYQSATELATELKTLMQELEVEAHLERIKHPNDNAKLTRTSPATTLPTLQPRQTNSGNYELDKVKLQMAPAWLTVVGLMVGILSVGTYLYVRKTPPADNNKSISSIAVIPFVNASNDLSVEYLSDGLSESLINSLSQIPELKVTARSSSFKYKGKEFDQKEVAKALGVEAILTGRVLQHSDKLVVNVELINAQDATQLWGEQYNRNASDLLAVQDEISYKILEALRLHLTPVEQQRLAKPQTANLEAYELLLKGRFYWSKGTTENQKKAIELFKQAIAVDPDYALAHAELSLGYNALVNANVLEQKEFIPKAEAAAHKAIALDENLVEAHLALAVIKTNAWEWENAERELKRAIELNPNLALAHRNYTFFLMIQGRYEEAAAEAKRVRELDPLWTGNNNVTVYGLMLAGQKDEALKAAKKMLEFSGADPYVHVLIGQVYTSKGQHREALSEFQEVLRLGDDSPDMQVYLGAAYARAGMVKKARSILKELESGKQPIAPAALAIVYSALGEKEQAFALLERAFAAHDQQLIWLGLEAGFEPLRDDPRFDDLMRRVGVK